jgi:hypothetical protein
LTDDDLIHPVPFEPRPLRLAPKTRPPRRVPKAALLGLPVLLAGAATLLAARAVEVVVDPVPDRVSVSGLQLPLGRLRLLFPGRHEVRAEKAGWKPLEATFDVTRDPRQVARFTLERLPTFLTLEVEPGSGVRVQVDGTEQGVTPLPPLELPEGQHEVVLRAEGYTTHTAQVAAAGGGDAQTLRAVLAPDRAPVSFSSDPSGATVSVDGASLGATPLSADLSSGTRKVEVARSGYRPASARIEVTAGKPLAVPTFRLEPLPGRVAVTTEPTGATVAETERRLREAVTYTSTAPPQEEVCCALGHAVTPRTGCSTWDHFTGERCLGRRRRVGYSRPSMRSSSGSSTARGARRDRSHFESSRLPHVTCDARCAARPIANSPRVMCA